jgi:hypothetical protein
MEKRGADDTFEADHPHGEQTPVLHGYQERAHAAFRETDPVDRRSRAGDPMTDRVRHTAEVGLDEAEVICRHSREQQVPHAGLHKLHHVND